MTRATAHQLKNAFGFDPAESAHHFVVLVPRAAAEQVSISEHHGWDEARGSGPASLNARDGQLRVLLARPKWEAIADYVRAQFNRRLKRLGRAAGNWQTGPNLVRRDLGKELVLLAWAIEEADPALIPNAVANWDGLEPEERWWLYTMTAAGSGQAVKHRGVGWRKAVRYALTENPVATHPELEARMPEFFQRAAAPLLDGPAWEDLGEE